MFVPYLVLFCIVVVVYSVKLLKRFAVSCRKVDKKAMLHSAMVCATCLATSLRDKLHEQCINPAINSTQWNRSYAGPLVNIVCKE